MEELFNLVERYLIQIVVQVGMAGSRHNVQFLIVPLQLLESVFTEIT